MANGEYTGTPPSASCLRAAVNWLMYAINLNHKNTTMKSITISFILILYTSLSFAQENSGLPLIDMHVHWGPGLEKYDERRIQTLDRLAENNVVMAVYFSKIPEALSREIQNAQTEMLPYLGMICSESHSLYPCYPGSRGAFPDLDWLRNEVQAGRIVGLGEVNAQYYSIKPTDPRMEPFFALAEELDIPVGYHMGLGPPGSAYRRPYRLSYGNPLLLEEILVRYPKLRLYVQHAALPYLQEMMGIMNHVSSGLRGPVGH